MILYNVMWMAAGFLGGNLVFAAGTFVYSMAKLYSLRMAEAEDIRERIVRGDFSDFESPRVHSRHCPRRN